MNAHKNDLRGLSTRQLLARRRAAAARLGDVEQVLAGTLTEQARRCGQARLPVRGRRAARPVCLLHPAPGRPRPGPVRAGRAGRGGAPLPAPGRAEVEAVLAEISAINAELLARRELR